MTNLWGQLKSVCSFSVASAALTQKWCSLLHKKARQNRRVANNFRSPDFWKTPRRFQRYSEYFLLMYNSNSYMTLPMKQSSIQVTGVFMGLLVQGECTSVPPGDRVPYMECNRPSRCQRKQWTPLFNINGRCTVHSLYCPIKIDIHKYRLAHLWVRQVLNYCVQLAW